MTGRTAELRNRPTDMHLSKTKAIAIRYGSMIGYRRRIGDYLVRRKKKCCDHRKDEKQSLLAQVHAKA